MGSSLNSTVPAVGLIRPRTQRPIVVLPEPDSPTSATVSPASTSKLTPFTAWTSFFVPADTVPTFKAENNKILWQLKVCCEIPGWPDSEDEYEVLVQPGGGFF